MKSQNKEVQRELISSTKNNNNNDWVLNGCIVYESEKREILTNQGHRYDKITVYTGIGRKQYARNITDREKSHTVQVKKNLQFPTRRLFGASQDSLDRRQVKLFIHGARRSMTISPSEWAEKIASTVNCSESSSIGE